MKKILPDFKIDMFPELCRRFFVNFWMNIDLSDHIQSNTSKQIKREEHINPSCHGNILCPGDIGLIVTDTSFAAAGGMKNSRSSFAHQSPKIYSVNSAPSP